MVRVLFAVVTWIIMTLTMTFVMASQAETTLNASVDRNKIYETDTLNLLISGDIELEFSISGIMNFGRNQIQAPELVGLENDFEILDQQQKYNMQSINGDTKAQVTWNYTLAPKRSGILTIPKAVYKTAESTPIQVTVAKGTAPKDSSNPPRVFIETEVDKHQAYVQEQVLYTIRLYAADNLAGGDLSVPESNDAIIESLGDTRKYYRMAYNQRYEVRERQYLVFPQKSGELVIESQSFNGTMIDSQRRRRVRVREVSDAVSLQIKPPPASFTGQTWLPATQFSLTEKWDVEPEQLIAGDSISRTLEINALGLLGSALPPLEMANIKGLNIYPDQPEVESLQHDAGAKATRRQTFALVAVSPITTELPEIRIPWWDTINNVEKVAVIPARNLNIKPNPSVVSQQQANSLSARNAATTQENNETETGQQGNHGSDITPNTNNQPLYVIIVLLIIAWASTTWWLLKRQQGNTVGPAKSKPGSAVQNLYPQLINAIKKDQPDMPNYLLQWARSTGAAQQSGIDIESLQDLAQISAELHQLALAFEQSLYAKDRDRSGYDKKRLLQCVKRLANEKRDSSVKTTLAPMYPD